jgi:hypothetical protein
MIDSLLGEMRDLRDLRAMRKFGKSSDWSRLLGLSGAGLYAHQVGAD